MENNQQPLTQERAASSGGSPSSKLSGITSKLSVISSSPSDINSNLAAIGSNTEPSTSPAASN